ncbi:asparaginase [Tritonibacter horizontis]|uniref:L-asparaginase II n=1 Tax=Tritonibacter horizontis TaxID=1768241 RepID=A0A132BZN2_9RHOB|nr:asparaginase [Tritonibacter horizontis]KUP93230.1 L-asparaginase II [Tritonibacter horizontis]
MSQPSLTATAAPLTEIWRGTLLESLHLGHAVVCNGAGEVVQGWGDPATLIYPRSSCKMLQALPLLTSGAAARYGLTSEQLALACASHNAARIHVDRVRDWLDQLDLGAGDLRCGAQMPRDTEVLHALIKSDDSPCQIHNNCSGKHAGFLTLAQHLGAGPDYVESDHPVQQACRAAFEDSTGEDSPTYGIDGCSAPNFACTVTGLARAMGRFASAHRRSGREDEAAVALRSAMAAHPELVAGEGRACTALMRDMGGKVAVKTGAEGVFVAILPEQELGIALKVVDGATRAAECAIAALLVRLGALDKNSPSAKAYLNAPITNWNGIHCGEMRPAAELLARA